MIRQLILDLIVLVALMLTLYVVTVTVFTLVNP